MNKFSRYTDFVFSFTRRINFFIITGIMLLILSLFFFVQLNSRLSDSYSEKARLTENSVTLAFDKLDNVLNSCDNMIKENPEIINSEFKNLSSIDMGNIIDELNAFKLQCPFIYEIVMYKPSDTDTVTTQGLMAKASLFNLEDSSESTRQFWEYAMLEYITPFVLSLRSEEIMEINYGFISTNKSFFVVPQIHPVYNIGFLIFVDEGTFISHLSLPDSGKLTDVFLYNEDGNLIFSDSSKDKAPFDMKKIEGKSEYSKGGCLRTFEYVKWFKYNNLLLRIRLDNSFAVFFIHNILLLTLLFALLYIAIRKRYEIYKTGMESILSGCKLTNTYENLTKLPAYISEGLNLKENYELRRSLLIAMLNAGSPSVSANESMRSLLSDFAAGGSFRISFAAIHGEGMPDDFSAEKELLKAFDEETVVIIPADEKTCIVIESCATENERCFSGINIIIDSYSKESDVFFVYGRIFSDFSDINREYCRLKSDLKYVRPLCKNTVTSAKKLNKDTGFYETDAMKSELLQYISESNPYELKKYISDKAEELISENLTMNSYIYAIQSVYNCFLSVASSFDIDKATLNKFSESFFREIKKQETQLDFAGIKNTLTIAVSGLINEAKLRPAGDLNKKIISYINQNFNTDMGLEELAEHLDLSSKYLSYYFKKEFKIGFLKFLTVKRIEKAKELLINTDKSIADISAMVGYASNVTFAGIFKKYTGMTPSLYRQSGKNK